jgi:hypothetical protein
MENLKNVNWNLYGYDWIPTEEKESLAKEIHQITKWSYEKIAHELSDADGYNLIPELGLQGWINFVKDTAKDSFMVNKNNTMNRQQRRAAERQKSKQQQMLFRVTNPYTGDTVILNQKATDMYVEIKKLEQEIWQDPDMGHLNQVRNQKIERFDKLRLSFRMQWSREYYALLD